MARTHTPVHLPNDWSVAKMGPDNIVMDSPVNDATTETTLACCLDSNMTSDIGLSGNNLIATGAGSSNWGQLEGTIAIAAGTKGYYEVTISGTSTANVIGWGESAGRSGTGSQSFAEGDTIGYQPGSDVLYTGTGTTAAWTSYTAAANDIIMFAYDATSITAVKFWVGINGTWRQSGDPAAGTNAAVTYDLTAGTIRGGQWVPLVACHTITDRFRFSSDSWVYSAPTGFSALTKAVTGFGNYITWDFNSTDWPAETDSGATVSLDNGNRNLSGGQAGVNTARAHSTFGAVTGKWYWELDIVGQSGAHPIIGLSNLTFDESVGADINIRANDGHVGRYPGEAPQSYGVSYTTGDVIQVALDRDNGAVWFGKNGTWMNSATKAEIEAATTTNAASTSLNWSKLNDGLTPMGPAASASGTTVTLRAASYEWTEDNRPAGFKALGTHNLPAPAISDPSAHFKTILYTGSSASPYNITGISDNSGATWTPDLVWLKQRTTTTRDHYIFDTLRGHSKGLFPSYPQAEDSTLDHGKLTAFNDGGFTLSDGSLSGVSVKEDGESFVAWCWKAGGAPSSNSDGTITTSVSLNSTAGFVIGTYTANNTAGATIGHGLGQKPDFFIIKCRDSGDDFVAHHKDMSGDAYYCVLNSDAIEYEDTVFVLADVGDDTITFGSNPGNIVNNSSHNYIFYAWHSVEGYSSFGKYIANGTTSGAFCYTGFKPAWVMIKKITTATQSWIMKDGSRNPHNPATRSLYANLNYTESPDTVDNDNDIDLLATGFRIKNSAHTGTNSSGETYIYCAFAEMPMANNGRAR